MVVLSPLEKVVVKTTLPACPYPPLRSREHIETERLLLRPLQDSDADAMHVLRTQPEVMIWTSVGRPDADMEATKKNMSLRYPPHDVSNYDFAICVAKTGELIGVGGSHQRQGELGWPAVGYMLRKEAWGKGYGTEFLKGFLKAWWQLPREEVEIEVDKDTVDGGGAFEQERIVAVTVEENKASQNVMSKCGLTLAKIWEEEDSHGTGDMIALYGFVLSRPEPGS
jgi:RimJ/RimL family protein N-acetyltransferase